MNASLALGGRVTRAEEHCPPEAYRLARLAHYDRAMTDLRQWPFEAKGPNRVSTVCAVAGFQRTAITPTPRAASTSPMNGCELWERTASRSLRRASRTASSSARSAFTPTANSAGRTARRRSWRRSGGGSRRPARGGIKKFAFLINNGRANHVWQSAYLDQEEDFVTDRWPYPFRPDKPGRHERFGPFRGRSRRGRE